MAKKIPYLDGRGNVIDDTIVDVKNPQLFFNPNDPNSQSRTNQSDKDEVDINKIMERYEKTGVIPDALTGVPRTPIYGDFSNMANFHELQNTIAKVNQAFAAYPAAFRARFGNDPAQLIDWLSDPKNDVEAVKLGIKDPSVLLVALADDGKTKITQADRDNLDTIAKAKADAAAAAKNATVPQAPPQQPPAA